MEEAINRLECIRVPSGNDPQVLRLLVAYNTAVEPPNYDQAYTYACELEEAAGENTEIRWELAQFYVSWSTALKMRFEPDFLKNMERERDYKDHADKAIRLLNKLPAGSHSWHHLLAQSYFNKWDYDQALGHVEKALQLLPKGSHLFWPYNRLSIQHLEETVHFRTEPRISTSQRRAVISASFTAL